jgi:DNA-binding response OmpR family regulator
MDIASGPDLIGDGPPMTILLVEDDAAVALITAVWLRKLGFDVVISHNGREAAALAAGISSPIGLLLTDVVLPGMRGPTLAGAVRARHPETAVLFTSGYSPELMSEVFAPDVDQAPLLRKPYTADQFASGVRAALARKAAGNRRGA